MTINKTYDINFYQIYEDPPAASVEIKSDGDGKDGKTEADDTVTNRLTGILYTNQYYWLLSPSRFRNYTADVGITCFRENTI